MTNPPDARLWVGYSVYLKQNVRPVGSRMMEIADMIKNPTSLVGYGVGWVTMSNRRNQQPRGTLLEKTIYTTIDMDSQRSGGEG